MNVRQFIDFLKDQDQEATVVATTDDFEGQGEFIALDQALRAAQWEPDEEARWT